MDYRPFGRTGVRVSPLCLGCMNFGGRTEPDESVAVIHQALEAGINFVDTADIYTRGASEEVVGRALVDRRDRVVLASKGRGRMGDDPNAAGVTRRHLIDACEASLRRLRTDWIDLYQIHAPDPNVPIDETLRALDDLVRSGKVRYIGTSNYAAWQSVEALWASKELGLNRFVSEQPRYSLLHRKIEAEKLPMARSFGLAVIPWGPLAGGFLTGKYRRDHRPEGARLTPEEKWSLEGYGEQAFALIDRMEEMAGEKGCSISQLALAWILAQPGITAPIIGPRTAAQLEDNLGALAVTVSEQDCDRLDEIVPPHGRPQQQPHRVVL